MRRATSPNHQVEELQRKAEAAIVEATLMEEQAKVIEAEALRIKKDVERRMFDEPDESRKRCDYRYAFR
jgi:hypothetical protein